MSILSKDRGRRLNKDVGSKQIAVRVVVAADAAGMVPVYMAVRDEYLHSAYFIPDATLAEHGSNYRTLQLQDKGTDGTGTTVASTLQSTITTTGTGPLTAHVAKDLQATSGYKLTAGKTLALAVTDNGTTVALNGTLVLVLM